MRITGEIPYSGLFMKIEWVVQHWYQVWRMRIRNAKESVFPDETGYYCRAAAKAQAEYVMWLALSGR